MKIYVVSKMVDELDNPSSTAVSAHVDKSRADDAAKAIAGTKVVSSIDDLQSMTYGIVEEIELDLSGIDYPTYDNARNELYAAAVGSRVPR